MASVVIYKADGGRASVVYPTPEALEKFSILEIALRSVPKGKPYRIIDAADLPANRTQRDAWTVDDADLTDGIGGAD